MRIAPSLTNLFLTFAFCAMLHAQTQGQITGVVTDASGAVIVGATVTVTNQATNVTQRVATNGSGVYSFPALFPGTYQLKAEMQGFQSMVRGGVALEVQQVVRIDFHMAVGQATEVVNVSGAQALLNTENATVGTVIDTQRIVDLPLNGRDFLQLVSLSPNVVYGFAPAGQQVSIQGGQRAQITISVSGERSEFNHFTLDGIEDTDNNFNDYLFLPSIDALQEFKVQSGIYPAEFGRNVGQVNVSTKSGTNEYHATLFEFFRNSKMDADNYGFTSGVPLKSPLVRNQFGFTLGGPVIIPKLFNGKNRLFFLTNYEGQRWRSATQEIASVPTTAQRGGDFSSNSLPIYDPATRVQNASGQITAQPFPGNMIPASRFDKSALILLPYYGAPNIAGATANNYQVLGGTRQDADEFTLRTDFAETATSTWFGRWSQSDESSQTPSTFPGQGLMLTTGVHQAILGNTRSFSPTIVNEARFGYSGLSNLNLSQTAYTNNVVGQLGGIPGLATPIPITYGIPTIGITGYTGFGASSTVPDLTYDHIFQWIDNVSIVRGRHSLRFGAEVRRDRYNQEGNQFPAGSFGFSGQATQNPQSISNSGNAMADFMLGLVRTSAGAVLPLAVAQLRATAQYYYIDDSWKVRSNLTVTLGLRYELAPPYTAKHNELINTEVLSLFDPNRPPTVVREGTGNNFYQGLPWVYGPGIQVAQDGRMGDALVKTNYRDFAPRVGVAYSPSSNWTIRAGTGIFFAQDIGNAVYDMSRNAAVRRNVTANNNFPNLTLENPFGVSPGSVVVTAPTILSNQYNRRTPYVFQYVLNVQRQLTKSAVLEAGYMGSEGHFLDRFQPFNFPLPGPGSVQANRPFPALGIIQEVEGVVNSNYNSLSLKFTQRLAHGVNALVGYTFAKSIDDGSAIRSHGGDYDFPQNTYNLAGERGLSNFSQEQRFVSSLLWEPPLGKGQAYLNHGVGSAVLGNWQLTSIVTLATGLPYSVLDGVDVANIGWTPQHVNLTGAPIASPNQTPNEWFNTAAFAQAPAYTFGAVGRNTMIGPSLFSWDFSALKTIPIWERHELQFRFEAFNFPNHPSFYIPNATLPSKAFGTITTTETTMRELQLSLKYQF